MNNIGSAPSAIQTLTKSPRGMDNGQKLENGNETKFQLPEKKSNDGVKKIANQNEPEENSKIGLNEGDQVTSSEDGLNPSQTAEQALLNLINSYQPNSAADKNSDDVKEDVLTMEQVGEQIDLDASNISVEETIQTGVEKTSAELIHNVKVDAGQSSQSNLNNELKISSALTSTNPPIVSASDKQDSQSRRADVNLIEKEPITTKFSSSAETTDAVTVATQMAAANSARTASTKIEPTDKVEVTGKAELIGKGEQTVKREQTDDVKLDDVKKSNLLNGAEKAMNNSSQDKNSQQRDDRTQSTNISLTDKIGTKMEGVEVLQARNFTAMVNPSTNANNISQAILNSQQLSSSAAAQNAEPIYSTAQPKALNTLKIQLNPAELGVVTATMKLSGGDLQVQLRVESVEAYRLLSEDSTSIVKALKGQGFAIDQINVQLASPDRNSGLQGNQQNGQSFQSHAEQEQMRNQNGNDRNNGSSNSQNSEGRASGNEDEALGQMQTLSDGVYL